MPLYDLYHNLHPKNKQLRDELAQRLATIRKERNAVTHADPQRYSLWYRGFFFGRSMEARKLYYDLQRKANRIARGKKSIRQVRRNRDASEDGYISRIARSVGVPVPPGVNER